VCKKPLVLSYRLFVLYYRYLKCFTEDAVLIYSGVEFQIEVPENITEFRIYSLGIDVQSWTLDDDLNNLEWVSDVKTREYFK